MISHKQFIGINNPLLNQSIQTGFAQGCIVATTTTLIWQTIGRNSFPPRCKEFIENILIPNNNFGSESCHNEFKTLDEAIPLPVGVALKQKNIVVVAL